MTSAATKPKRADALRNYEKLIAAARAAFTEDGSKASLEDIARRAEVGIGTLYRNFPTRQALLEAVYVDEVEALGRAAEALADQDPWDALVTWLRQFIGYMATKQALAEELLNYMDRDAGVFQSCRTLLHESGAQLLKRAQDAGAARRDTDISDVIRLIGGIAKMPSTDPEQTERVLEMAFDGLRA